MHPTRTLFVALALVSCRFAEAATPVDENSASWRVTSVWSSGGESPSLAFNSSGTPEISFHDRGLWLAQLSGTTWPAELIDPSPVAGRHSSLAFDSYGLPVMAYHGDALGTNLRVAAGVWGCGFYWDVRTIISFQSYRSEAGESLTPSLAIRSDGQAAVAFFHSVGAASATPDGVLYFAQLSDGLGATADADGYTGWTPSLAFGPDGQPAIACIRYDADRTHGELRLARRTGTVWTATTIDGADGPPSLAFGRNGQPAIAYSSGGNLRLARFSAGTWSLTTVDSPGHSPTLKFGPDGQPAIAYVGNGSLRFARLDGSTWYASTVDSSGGLDPSLAFGRDGRPAIAYCNGGLQFAELVILPPAISLSPQPQATMTGGVMTLSVNASGIGLTYEWRFNGVRVPGATGSTYTIPSAQSFHAGNYTVAVSNAAGSVTSAAASVTVNAVPSSDARLLNVSNRGLCGVGDHVLIAGFVVSTEGSKRLLVRAVGPTLATLSNLTDTQPDPQLTIYRHEVGGSDTRLLTNDDWGVGADAAATADAAVQVGAFPLPAGSKDAAFVVTLPPGVYTAVVNGVGGVVGTALVEVYDVQ